MAATVVNPKDLAPPRGFSHGMIASGRTLYVAGQTGTDGQGKSVGPDLIQQFDRALTSVVRVVQEAGGKAEDIVKMNLYVVDKKEYREKGKEIGAAYRKHMGRHYPAMTLAEVKGLFADEAKVEIEAIAMLP
jgi:enamine deaminase RidA (YjgF/YER057c/UK114 family)